MAIEYQIKDGNLQYGINREAAKYQFYHQVKLISMNVLLVKRYYHLVNNKQLNKLSLLILLWEKLLKDKQNLLKIKGKNKLKQFKIIKNNQLMMMIIKINY